MREAMSQGGGWGLCKSLWESVVLHPGDESALSASKLGLPFPKSISTKLALSSDVPFSPSLLKHLHSWQDTQLYL